MIATRRQRAESIRERRKQVLLVTVTAVGLAAITTAAALGAIKTSGTGGGEGDRGGIFGRNQAARASLQLLPDRIRTELGDSSDSSEAPAAAEVDVQEAIEVPDVVGKSIAEAKALLEAVGLGVELIEDRNRESDIQGDDRSVIAQNPEEGAVVRAGAKIGLTVAAEPDGGRTVTRTRAGDAGSGSTVVIDPGHQSRGDPTHEPIGPGATETKPRVTGGTTGVSTRVPEYEVALQISMNLKTRLEAAGVNVIMTRTTNDVNISNSERALMANEARADLFVRVHADGSTDSTRCGIATLYPGENRWTTPIVARSKRAATLVQESMVAATGATDLGITARTDLSGFNWSKVPAILVECGFLTNSVEDKLLSSPHYQDKLAEGMTAGIIRYLGE